MKRYPLKVCDLEFPVKQNGEPIHADNIEKLSKLVHQLADNQIILDEKLDAIWDKLNEESEQ